MGKNVKRKKKKTRMNEQARRSKFTMIAISFVVCMLFGILLYEGTNLQLRIKENEERKEELTSQIEEEKERTKEIDELEEYMQTDEFIARKAQSTLGLVRENEIILKPEE